MIQYFLAFLTVPAPAVAIATPATSDDVAPYARVFQEDQRWELASSSNEQPARCRVKEVSLMCDRTASEIECDGEAQQVLAGTYVFNGRGMWRVDGDAHQDLDAKHRTLARFPESNVDGAGNTLATPFGGGWCTTDTANGATRTICISEDQGFIGGRVTTAAGKTITVGSVPR